MSGEEEAIPLTDDIDKTFKPIFEQVMIIIFCMQNTLIYRNGHNRLMDKRA